MTQGVPALGRTTAWVVASAFALLGGLAIPRWQVGGDEPSGIRAVIEVRLSGQPERLLTDSVTAPIERRLLALPGAARVVSETTDGFVRWTVDGAPTASPDDFATAVERTVFTSSSPAIDPANLTVDMLPLPARSILDLFVTGTDPAARSAFARGVVLPALARVHGSGRIEVTGLAEVRAVVEPRAADLTARGMTALDLLDRLRGLAAVVEAGRVRDGARVHPLAVDDRPASLADLSALTLTGPQGTLRLADVATVAARDVGDGTWASWNEQPAIRIRLYPRPGRDEAGVATRARDRVAELAAHLPPGVGIQVAQLPEPPPLPALLVALLAALGLALAVVPFLLRAQPRLVGASFLSLPLALLGGAAAVALWSSPPLVPAAVTAGAAIGIAVLCMLEGPVGAAFASHRLATVGWSLGIVAASSAAWGAQTVAATLTGCLVSAAISCILNSDGSLWAPSETRDTRREPSRPSALRAAIVVLVAVAGLAALLAIGGRPPSAPGAPHARETPTLAVRFALVPPPGADDVARANEAFAGRVFAAMRAQHQPTAEWASYTPVDPPPAEPSRTPAPGVAPPEALPGLLAWQYQTGTDLAAIAAIETRLRQFLAQQPGVLAWVSPGGSDEAPLQSVVVAAEHSQWASGSLIRQGATLVDESVLRQTPTIRLAWNSWLVDRAATARDELSQQVAAGLGRVDAGTVAIRGVEPAVWLAATVPTDLRQLPVRVASRTAGPPEHVVPLAAVARFVPGMSAVPAVHLDGRPAARLWFAPRSGTPAAHGIVPLADGAHAAAAWQALPAAALLLIGFAAAAATGSMRSACDALAATAAAACGSLAVVWAGGGTLGEGALLGALTVFAVGSGMVLGSAQGQPPSAVAPAGPVRPARFVPAFVLAALLLGGLSFLVNVPVSALSRLGLGPELAEPLRSCAFALAGGTLTLAWVIPLLAPRERNAP